MMRSERGFTLIELLIAISVGSVIMLATFAMLDGSVTLTGNTQKRVDATQRGRIAMEAITSQLRSQVCPNSAASALIGAGSTGPASDQYQVNFWSFRRTGAFVPERRVITWDTNTDSIVQRDYNQAGTLLRTNLLLRKVRPATTPANAPIFSYWAYPTTPGATTPSNGPLPTPLSAADAASVALIKVRFTAQPDTSNGPAAAVPPQGSQTFSDQVFARTADPNNPDGPKGPICG
jgi:prepilin-type N-terminal cleavage/methylation domain-containing protein